MNKQIEIDLLPTNSFFSIQMRTARTPYGANGIFVGHVIHAKFLSTSTGRKTSIVSELYDFSINNHSKTI